MNGYSVKELLPMIADDGCRARLKHNLLAGRIRLTDEVTELNAYSGERGFYKRYKIREKTFLDRQDR